MLERGLSWLLGPSLAPLLGAGLTWCLLLGVAARAVTWGVLAALERVDGRRRWRLAQLQRRADAAAYSLLDGSDAGGLSEDRGEEN